MGITPKALPTMMSCSAVVVVSVMPIPEPLVMTRTTPRQRYHVPIVATRDGTPNLTTIKPLISPAIRPKRRHAKNPSQTLPVATKTTSYPTIPKAITEAKERSISPVMMTRVSGMAIRAKYGVVDMNEM